MFVVPIFLRRPEVAAILAIDAAWTPTEPSGLALLAETNSIWHCLALAPSYDQFINQCLTKNMDWTSAPRGSLPDIGQLLAACKHRLDGQQIDIVTIDMPVSRGPIHTRRDADQTVSKTFGGQGCGTHSPNQIRPGPLGAAITDGFCAHGYPVATCETPSRAAAHLIEVYPHPALLKLLGVSWRVPYKVAKSNRYWPKTTVETRISLLRSEFGRILVALSRSIEGIESCLPEVPTVNTLADLKRFEDAIDALVCGWVGICYLRGDIKAYGDTAAAIWVPTGLSAEKPKEVPK